MGCTHGYSMSSDDSVKVRGIEMDTDEIERTLRELGHGTLSLSRDGNAYGVPISFGYDDGRLFMHLIRFGDESKKLDFSETTMQACLTAYRVDSRFAWKSVVVTGTLEDVSDEETEYMEEVMDKNAWFPNIFPPTAPIAEISRVELVIDEMTGRKGEEYQ